MERNRFIIVALIIIIAILIIGLAVIMPGFGKEKANLTIKSNDTISQGESIKVELTDVNGTPIENETVNVTISDENGTEESEVAVTDDEGVVEVTVDVEDVGNYTVECTFEGNENFTENTTVQEIEVVEEEIPEEIPSSSEEVDPGAFYSGQEGRIIYTGEVHDAPDGHKYKHLGNNEWEKID